jgi:ribose transport system substrate-binding protein
MILSSCPYNSVDTYTEGETVMSDESIREARDGPGELESRRFDRRKLVVGATGIAGALAFGKVGSAFAYVGRTSNSKSVAFAQPDTAFAGYPLLLHGAQTAASSRGYQLLESHANSKLDAQVNEINTWIAQGIGGIIVLPLDNNAMLPLIKKAHAAGVKFLDYSDNALPGVDGWVIFNNLQGAHLGGTYLGKWVNKTLGGKAKVALLTHEIQKTGRDRIHGSVTAMQAVAPGAKVVARHEGVLAADCLTVAQSILQAHPDLNAFICIADDGCLGAERAFLQTHPSAARKKTMAMIGYDGTTPVFQRILAGSVIRATGALDLVAIGAASVTATINAIEGKGPTKINFPYVLASQSPAGLVVTRKLLKKYKAITG